MELLALAAVDSLVLVGQKRGRGKTRSSSVVVRDFYSPRSQHLIVNANGFFTCSLEISFLPFLMGPITPAEVFCKCFYAVQTQHLIVNAKKHKPLGPVAESPFLSLSASG